MAQRALALARALDVDRSAVLHALLRQVEDVAGRVVRADPGEGPRRRPLQHLDRGIALGEPREGALEIVDLHAEMIEPGGAARLARIDIEPDVAVAHGHRALGPGLVRRGHAEGGLVELSLQRVLIADDGDVSDPGWHGRCYGPFRNISWNSASARLNSRASFGLT